MNGPYICSALEAKYYYYGIPTQPLFVARSSADLWLEPKGPEAYLDPKECTPVGPHPLNDVWESTVGNAMDAYLQDMGVKCTSLDPVRIGIAGEAAPVIIWVGVIPGSLSAQVGIQVALHCRAFLTDHDITDVHVEIRESETTLAAKLYTPILPVLPPDGPDLAAVPVAEAIEPFTPTLGIPICNAATPNIQGTAAFFFTDPAQPGTLFLITARHVVIHPDQDNDHYAHTSLSQPKKMVLLMGDAFARYTAAIELQIRMQHIHLDILERQLLAANVMGGSTAEIEQVKTTIVSLENLLVDINRDFKDPSDRVLGHVVLSPPIAVNVGDEGYTEDWAVIEVDTSKLSKDSFPGNAIDLGTSTSGGTLSLWMHSNPINPSSFKYPTDRLLRFTGTLSDNDMLRPDPKIFNHNNDPVIMVLKRGCTSGLTVGRLNTIRSFVRFYLKGQPGEMSKQIAVLPRNSKSGPFSEGGDSGSVVLDGTGRVVGLLTGGTRASRSECSDCTYLTSIQFLLSRLANHGIKANIFPTVDNV